MSKILSKYVDFQVLNLTWNDITKLDIEDRAAYALMSFALNEINQVGRLLAFVPAGKDDELNKDIEFAAGLTVNFLLRTLSSKLFELKEFFELKGKYNRSKSKILLSIQTDLTSNLEQIRVGIGYKFAKKIRHEASFHYHLKTARLRVVSTSDQSETRIFKHKMPANSYYPMGEEAFFAGLINEFLDENGLSNDLDTLITEWGEWCINCIVVFNKLFEHFSLKAFGEKRLAEIETERRFIVPAHAIRELGTETIPFFVSRQVEVTSP